LKEEALKEVLYWLISDNSSAEKPVEQKQQHPEPPEPQKAQPETAPSSIDLNQLFAIFDNDKDFVIALLEVFITETPEDFNSLRNCIEREYYTRASTLAHKMKSSFMNLGMTEHGHHLQQIETHLKNADKIEEAKTHLKAFEMLYNKALVDVNLQLIGLKEV